MGRPARHAGGALKPEPLAALRTRTTWVTYLEMTAPPARALLPPPAGGLQVQRAERPPLAFYRQLYNRVGEAWTWVARLDLDDASLTALLHDDAVEVQVLREHGEPVGFVELDCRASANVEIVYFGLVPECIGRGLGAYLLDWTIGHVWARQPARLWLHTCDLDHPGALGLYLRAGFRIFARRCEPVLPA